MSILEYSAAMDDPLKDLVFSRLGSHKDTDTDTYPIFDKQINSITVPPPGRQELPLDSNSVVFPASTLAFDTQQELLWIGNEYVSLLFISMGA